MDDTIKIFLSIIPAIATGAIGYIFYKIKRYNERREAADEKRAAAILLREEATGAALRALCRDRILQGYRYYRQRGYVSTQDFESMTKLYNAYHSLGGNGTISAVFDKICALPLKDGV